MIFPLDPYSNSMMQYWPQLKCYYFLNLELVDILHVLIIVYLNHHKSFQLLSIVLASMDEFQLHLLILLLIFIHYLVFDRFYLNREMIRCYYCAWRRRVIVSMPRDKTISDNNIWQGTISTKDLRICLIQLHKLRAP